MTYWRPLSHGSKNPPLNQQILLKAYDGSWGIGIAYKSGGRIYFQYEALLPVRAWSGLGKEQFVSWASITL